LPFSVALVWTVKAGALAQKAAAPSLDAASTFTAVRVLAAAAGALPPLTAPPAGAPAGAQAAKSPMAPSKSVNNTMNRPILTCIDAPLLNKSVLNDVVRHFKNRRECQTVTEVFPILELRHTDKNLQQSMIDCTVCKHEK
jgi:hypothetical protein